MALVVVVVLALLVIAASVVAAPRLGVPAPLILVLLGIGISLLPETPVIEIDPEWILAGVLPPLLYSASVAMPAMNFRREFGAIGGLSVGLVVINAVVLGLFFSWVIPDLPLAWGIALGAVISPTDAVATSIAKRMGVSPRVLAMLEGESLLNDATALVLLRTAIVSAAVAFSFWHTVGQFAFAVIAAIVIGYLVGRGNLVVRAKVKDTTVNTVLAFTVPFVASIPAELIGASGLVAAVVAGIVTGRHGPRMLPPQHRHSDAGNWRTLELVLEGAVFLLMGLELAAVLADVQREHAGLGSALLPACAALAITMVIRAGYVAPLLMLLRRQSERGRLLHPRIARLHEIVQDPDQLARFTARSPRLSARIRLDVNRFGSRLRRMLADMDYFLTSPLTWRDGGVLVWAGMRGAVTVAAAQTLPAGTPHRSLLVLIAFAVATLSLLVQGGTLAAVVRVLKPTSADPEQERAEREQIAAMLDGVQAPTQDPSSKDGALALIEARREALLVARDEGSFGAEALTAALEELDAEQIRLEAGRK